MRKKGKCGAVIVSAAALFLALVAAGTTRAQQAKPIELTFGTPYAAELPVELPNKEWMQKIEKETQGRVRFKAFWAGTVISGMEGHEELAQGAADVGEISTLFARSGYYLTKGQFLFTMERPINRSKNASVKPYGQSSPRSSRNTRDSSPWPGAPMRLPTLSHENRSAGSPT